MKYIYLYIILLSFPFALSAKDYSGLKIGDALQGTYAFTWFTEDLGDMAIQGELKLQNGKYSFTLLNRRADYRVPADVRKEFQFVRKTKGNCTVKYLENFNKNTLLSDSRLSKRKDRAFAIIDFYPCSDDKKIYNAGRSDLSFRFFLHYDRGVFFLSHNVLPQPRWTIKKDFNPKNEMRYY